MPPRRDRHVSHLRLLRHQRLPPASRRGGHHLHLAPSHSRGRFAHPPREAALGHLVRHTRVRVRRCVSGPAHVCVRGNALEASERSGRRRGARRGGARRYVEDHHPSAVGRAAQRRGFARRRRRTHQEGTPADDHVVHERVLHRRHVPPGARDGGDERRWDVTYGRERGGDRRSVDPLERHGVHGADVHHVRAGQGARVHGGAGAVPRGGVRGDVGVVVSRGGARIVGSDGDFDCEFGICRRFLCFCDSMRRRSLSFNVVVKVVISMW